MNEVFWHEEVQYDKVSVSDEPLMYEAKDLSDPYSHTILHPVLVKLSKKIEMATKYNVTARFAASAYQVSGYCMVQNLVMAYTQVT